MRRTVKEGPAGTETLIGTTTASHQGGVVGVGAADKAVGGTEREDAGVVTLVTGPPRYEKLLLSCILSSMSNTKGSFSLVFRQCLTLVLLFYT